MAPYTFEGITQLDEGNEITKHDQYELVGIVVHSGQASAGHYYAFIKESRSGTFNVIVLLQYNCVYEDLNCS